VNTEFKESFLARYSAITDMDKFKEHSLAMPGRCIRVNTLKISVNDLVCQLQDDWNLDQIPWCKAGFWIKNKTGQRQAIGNLPQHSLGHFYVQEAASMIPPIILDPKPGEIVLDMCAAPGSKSTQICAMMQNEGILVANDYKGIRLAALSINLQRMGAINAVVTLMHGYGVRGMQFDKVLLDAPCSGTGTIMKSLKTIEIWNPLMIKRLAKQQKQLIATAYGNLKPGGRLVYSTCSIDPEENEEVIDHLLKEQPEAEVEEIRIQLNRSSAITEFLGKEYDGRVRDCLRIWPQDNNTEGFFVASIKKNA
jgi:NOL1/NOP2/sun family putative RNA methylase